LLNKELSKLQEYKGLTNGQDVQATKYIVQYNSSMSKKDTPALLHLTHLNMIKYSNSTCYLGTVLQKTSRSRAGIGYLDNNSDHYYAGEWVNNTYDGVGVLSITSKIGYQGEFENGNRHGVGLQTLDRGSEYLGEFLNNEYNGIGILFQKVSSLENGTGGNIGEKTKKIKSSI
jgi:MORN repeat